MLECKEYTKLIDLIFNTHAPKIVDCYLSAKTYAYMKYSESGSRETSQNESKEEWFCNKLLQLPYHSQSDSFKPSSD